MAQHSINLGARHYPLYQIQVLGHLLEGWMFTDPSQHEQGGKPFFSEAATTYSGLHIHPPTPSHTSTQTCACMQKYMFSISTCLITFSPLFFSPFLSTSFPPPICSIALCKSTIFLVCSTLQPLLYYMV